MRKVEGTISSGLTGLPILHAQVSVQNADTTPAQLYSDNGITPLDQPVLTDGLGYWSFYIADGTYTRVEANPDGSNPRTFTNVEMYEDARNVSVPVGEAAITIPSVGARMGRVSAYDSSGNPIAFDPFTGVEPTAAVAQEALLRAIGDSDELTRALAAETALGTRVTTAESEIDTLLGTLTSGRRQYATYASAVSDAATPVLYAAVVLGQVAEVPLTDAGTHTDPVVGGTVNNSGIFRWSVSPAGWQRISDVDAVAAGGFATAAAASATSATASAAASAASAALVTPPLNADTLTGARASAVLPAAQAATVVDTHFTLTNSGANISVNITGDQLGDTTTPVTATLQIVSGSLGTAFSVAVGRWYNISGTQIGGDVALTKTAGAISFTGAQPAGAYSLKFVVTPPATTVCRFLTYQFGNPARPTTDPWYLSLVGAGIAANDPAPVAFLASDANWNPLTGRVTVPATAGGSFQLAVPSGVTDGNVLWAFFDSPLEPTVWLQTVDPRYGVSGGGSGVGYNSQILHLSGHRYAVALYVQSAADGSFYGPRWTWNNTGAATYFENIALYVGVNAPFVEKASAIALKGIRDEIDAARIKPLVTLADDSCGISANQFQPSPGLSLVKFFSSGTRFQNFATPGNTLAQSASTAGLLPIHVSVTSGVIPASTSPVAITAWDYDPITSNSATNPEYDGYAYLCGVLGRLSADAWTGNSPSAGHLFFTPVVAPTWPIDVPAGSKLSLRASRKRKGGLTIFPISSVNGTGGGFASPTAFVDAVFAANDPATIAGFVGLTPLSSGYDTGASLLTPFAAKSYYSRLYNPNIMSAATVAEAMSLFGWTWAAGENAAWLAGNIGIPGSMRIVADGFHPYTDVASYVVAKNHFISAPVTSYLEAWA